MEENNATCENLANKIELKVTVLDQKINEMIHIRAQLLDAVKECKKECEPQNKDIQCGLI